MKRHHTTNPVTITLNPGQQTLYDKIVNQDFSKLLVLGAGGVGKSHVLCSAMSQLARSGVENMVLCAPTHLARLNITSKLDKDVRNTIETVTVASLLLKFGIQREDGTVQFTAGKMDKIDKYSIIALDETSMISLEDYMLFMQSKAKVIFLGDWAQLPPVMAKSAQGKANAHSGTGNLEVITLTQQMRQQGVIHAAAERNRTAVWFPERSETGAGGESITVHDTDRVMVESMVNSILNDPRGYNCVPHYRYIAYKNDQVRKVGKEIRDRVLDSYFGFDTRAIPFIFSEVLMLRENKKAIGYNGELVTVTNVKKDTGKYRQYPWDTYELVLRGSLGVGGIRTLPPCQYPQFEAYVNALQSKLRRHQIAGEAASASNTLAEIKRLRAQWTMVQFPYSITTHRSQGSTIENVYLDTLSFSRAPNRRAMLYVGISRASKTLHTVRVPANQKLGRAEVNAAYRSARAAYEDVTGESYRKVLRYLGTETGSVMGKHVATGYLLARMADLQQGEG
jgi:ATP-dependent exoDNAse (exonuclease V) alpha subunit